jgi:hypothetical protein
MGCEHCSRLGRFCGREDCFYNITETDANATPLDLDAIEDRYKYRSDGCAHDVCLLVNQCRSLSERAEKVEADFAEAHNGALQSIMRESEALARIKTLGTSSADEIRALGWVVAVHNDYRLNGEPYTFWLFTKDGCAVKGEGRTDAEALDQVRAALSTTNAQPQGADQFVKNAEEAGKALVASIREEFPGAFDTPQSNPHNRLRKLKDGIRHELNLGELGPERCRRLVDLLRSVS